MSSPTAAGEDCQPTKFVRQEGRGNTTARVPSAWFKDAAEVPPYTNDYRPYTGRQLQLSRRKNIENQEKSWDKYYSNNTVNGFKDRHYILREFPELAEALKIRMEDFTATVKGTNSNNSTASSEMAEAPSSTPSITGIVSPSMAVSNVQDMVHWTEIGCGVGNAMMPVFEEYYPVLRLSGFDISLVAVQLLQAKVTDFFHQQQEGGTVGTNMDGKISSPSSASISPNVAAHTEFIALNLGTHDMPSGFPAPFLGGGGGRSQADFASVVFVLSAIPPEEQDRFMAQAALIVKEGGWIFIRDYCKEDMAEKRFSAKIENSLVSESTYMRTNGTLSHFFSEESLSTLLKGAGFTNIHCDIVTRSVENRKEGKSMDRKWIQVRAQKCRKNSE